MALTFSYILFIYYVCQICQHFKRLSWSIFHSSTGRNVRNWTVASRWADSDLSVCQYVISCNGTECNAVCKVITPTSMHHPCILPCLHVLTRIHSHSNLRRYVEFIDAEVHASDAVPVNRLDRSPQTLKTRKCTAMIQSSFWTQTIGSWLLLQQILFSFCSIASFNTLWGSSHKHRPLVLLASVQVFVVRLTADLSSRSGIRKHSTNRKVSWRGSSRKNGCYAQTMHLYPFLLSLPRLVIHRLWRANINHFHASFPSPCCQVVCLCWHLTAQVLGKWQWKAQ